MKILNLTVFVAILALMFSVFGCEKKEEVKMETEVEKPSRVLDLSEVTTTMIVKEINLPQRLFTLDYGDGNEIVIEAANDVTNLDQINVGDKVEVTYISSRAVYVTSPDEDRPPVASSQAVEVDSKDGKPRKITVDIIEKTSIVLAVDAVKRTATLKDHEGKVRTIDVDPSVENLENVKVGDQVVYQFTKAIAVDITKVE